MRSHERPRPGQRRAGTARRARGAARGGATGTRPGARPPERRRGRRSVRMKGRGACGRARGGRRRNQREDGPERLRDGSGAPGLRSGPRGQTPPARQCAGSRRNGRSARLGSARLGSARLGSARLGSARLGNYNRIADRSCHGLIDIHARLHRLALQPAADSRTFAENRGVVNRPFSSAILMMPIGCVRFADLRRPPGR